MPADHPRRIPHADIARIVSEWPRRTGYARHIADTYGIPIGTAHRWIHEARRRGHLPDGNQDRPCRHCNGTGRVRWGKSVTKSEDKP